MVSKHPFEKNLLAFNSVGEPIYVYRPVISVGIQANGRTIRSDALVDTGSNFSIFDIGLAEILDIKLEGRKPTVEFSGVGGALVDGYEEDVTLVVGEVEVETSVFFAENISGQGYGLLGMYGFFDSHTVEFHLDEGYFSVEPVEK